MQRVRAGTAICALCHQAISTDADAVVTPDFLANDADPFFRFSDATVHRACFVVWYRRKAFIAHFIRVARSIDAARKAYKALGAELKALYLVMGRYDIVALVEAPDDTVAAKAALALASKGNVSSETSRAFSEE